MTAVDQRFRRVIGALLMTISMMACTGSPGPSISPSPPTTSPPASASETPLPPTPSPSPEASLAAPTGRLLIGRRNTAVEGPGPGLAYFVLDITTATRLELGNAQAATWSGDGQRVHLVIPDAECVPRLVTKAIDGSTLADVHTGLASGDSGFAWSPDDSWVIFARFRHGPPPDLCGSQGGTYPAEAVVTDVLAMRADGSDQRIIAPGGLPLAWSPDGRSVAMLAGTPAPFLVIDITTGATSNYGTQGGTVDLSLADRIAYSPDGSRLAFVYGGYGNYRVGLLSFAARSIRDIGLYGAAGNSLAWSPSGDRIAVMRGLNAGQLVLLDADGKAPEIPIGKRELGEFAPFPWSPDGNWLAAVGGPYFIDPATGKTSAGPGGVVLLISRTGSGRLVAVPVEPGFVVSDVRWAPAD